MSSGPHDRLSLDHRATGAYPLSPWACIMCVPHRNRNRGPSFLRLGALVLIVELVPAARLTADALDQRPIPHYAPRAQDPIELYVRQVVGGGDCQGCIGISPFGVSFCDGTESSPCFLRSDLIDLYVLCCNPWRLFGYYDSCSPSDSLFVVIDTLRAPCPATAVRPSSWGMVKTLFH